MGHWGLGLKLRIWGSQVWDETGHGIGAEGLPVSGSLCGAIRSVGIDGYVDGGVGRHIDRWISHGRG